MFCRIAFTLTVIAALASVGVPNAAAASTVHPDDCQIRIWIPGQGILTYNLESYSRHSAAIIARFGNHAIVHITAPDLGSLTAFTAAVDAVGCRFVIIQCIYTGSGALPQDIQTALAELNVQLILSLHASIELSSRLICVTWGSAIQLLLKVLISVKATLCTVSTPFIGQLIAVNVLAALPPEHSGWVTLRACCKEVVLHAIQQTTSPLSLVKDLPCGSYIIHVSPDKCPVGCDLFAYWFRIVKANLPVKRCEGRAAVTGQGCSLPSDKTLSLPAKCDRTSIGAIFSVIG